MSIEGNNISSLFLFAVIFSTVLSGQQAVSSATLGGRVEDPSGAPVEDTEVLLINHDRNQTARTKTSSDGYYQFLYVSPGNYEVKVQHPSFTVASRILTVAVGQALQVPIRLAVQGQSESIIVTVNTLMLETVRPR